MRVKAKWNIPKEELWVDTVDRELLQKVQEASGPIQSRCLKQLIEKYRYLINSGASYIDRVMPIMEIGLTYEDLLLEMEYEFYITCMKYDLSKKIPLTNRFRLRVGTFIHNHYEFIRSNKRSIEIDPKYSISDSDIDEGKKSRQSRFHYSGDMKIFENVHNTGSACEVEKLSFKLNYNKFMAILTPIEKEILDMKLRGIPFDRINARYKSKIPKFDAKFVVKNKMRQKAEACGLFKEVMV